MQKMILKRLGGATVALAVLMAGSLLFPLYLQDVVYRVVMLCGIAIIMAVSLNLINGFTGQFSIGHAGFQAVGAYVAAALTVYGHDKLFSFIPKNGDFSSPLYSLLSGGPVMLVSMLVGGLAAAGIGYLVGLPSLRLRGDYLAIVTLGFGEIIRVVVENLDVVGGPRGFSGDLNSGVQVPALTNFFWVYGTVLVVILVSRNLRFSVHGLSYLSVREDEIAAQAMGINTTTVKVKAFVLGAFFAGVAGALFAHYERTILITSFNFVRSFDFVTMVVLGGLGSITGAALAAVVLTALPEVLRYSLGQQANQYRLVVYALALVIMMLVRPQGIFGRGELSLKRFFRKK
nr:branched-chain amino acid ABC transporter permease [Armatimonas sp.]